MKPTLSLAAVALIVAGCGGSEDSDRTPVDVNPSPGRTEIVLAVGDEILVDSLLRIGFMGVTQDSRCPLSVVCPWAGDGAAEIAYSLGEGPSYPDTLHTTLEPHSVFFNGYEIALLDLMPYPYGTDPIPPDEYAVRLRVERVQR